MFTYLERDLKHFVPVCTPPGVEKEHTRSFSLVTYQSVPIAALKAKRLGGQRAGPVEVTIRTPSYIKDSNSRLLDYIFFDHR